MTQLGNLDIIYFSSIDWDHTWQRPQQLAHRLSHHGKLIYVNPLGLRSVVLKDFGRIARRVALNFSSRKTVALDPALRIYAPLFYFPFPESRVASRINGRLRRYSLQGLMDRLNIHTPVIWVGTPSPAVLEAIGGIRSALLVYDCLDNFPLFHKNPYFIVEAEEQFASRAQVVFATAAELYERMKQINPNTFLLPNAADFEHFALAARPGRQSLSDLANMRKPILGYMGEMAQWFDFDLIRAIAVEHPDWTIVLIGPLHVDTIQEALRLPNVHHLGRKNYAELPAYVSQFDVCLLPFKINALTSAVNPVKLYEYLAAGKPVVSTPLKEVLRYREVVEIASRTEFSDAIKRALETNDETKVMQRMEIARANTWDARVEEILRILRDAI